MQTEPGKQAFTVFSDLTDFWIRCSLFCEKVPARFCFRNKRQRSSVYFGYTFAPDDRIPLQLPDYRLFGRVVPICYDSGLIYRQLPWLHLAYEENEEVMSSMLVSLYGYYIISPNLGSHPVIV